MFAVVDFLIGKPDSTGRIIDQVLVKQADYAIYRVNNDIIVQYSDVPANMAAQKALLRPLLRQRGRLQFLAQDIHRATFYQSSLATALNAALGGDPDTAGQLLDQSISDALVDRARVGRQAYLAFAGSLALALAAVLIIVGGFLRHGAVPAGTIFLSAGGGAIGALLSVVTAISNRSVMLDGDWRTNALDGTLRILIGVISGFAISVLLGIGLIPQMLLPASAGTINQATLTLDWHGALGIGFVSGFLERLVPDLLSRFSQNTGAAMAPASSAAVAPEATPDTGTTISRSDATVKPPALTAVA